MAFSYAGTGRLFPFRSEDLFGILSYSYNPSTGDPFYYLDYGSVAELPIDSWVIANHANETIQSLANDRIIDLVNSGTGNYVDLGSINEIQAVSQDDWGLITTSSDVFSFGTFKLVSLPTWSVHKVWVGTGQIWERGRAITRLIAPYQASGTLRLSGLSTTFYVPSIATDGILPFRSFATQRTLVHELGTGSLKKFSGSAEAVTFNSEERQLLFSVNGSSDTRFTSNLDGSGIVSVDGTLDERYTPAYTGTGRLPSVSSLDERRTYNYDGVSHDLFVYKDFGSITSPVIDSWVIQNHANETIQSLANDRIIDLVNSTTGGQYLDFQSILIDGQDPLETVVEDWEYIWQGDGSRYAMGLWSLKGTAKQNFVPNWNGSGTLFGFGNGIGRVKPRWIAYVQTKISGAAKTNFSLLAIGGGHLFTLSNGEQRRTFGYEGTGSISTISGASESVSFNPEDRQLLFNISGIGHEIFTPNWNGSGTIPFSGHLSERQTDHWMGSGTLFNFSGGQENVVYDYNPLSHAIFEKRDFGSVSSPVIDSWVIASHANETIQSLANDRIIDLVYSTTTGQYLDFQSILIDGQDAPETVREDWEYIWQGTTRYAFGDLTIGGIAKTNFSLLHNGSGTIKVWIHGFGRTKPRWVAFVQTEIGGQAAESAVKRFTGTGTLFNFAKADENRTYDYVGSGELYAVNGAAESTGAKPPETTPLIKISGSAHEIFTPNWNSQGTIPFTGHAVERQTDHWAGSGSLWSWSGGQEVRTYDYNPLSHAIFEYRDYGSVASPVIDSWVIANHASETIQSLANDKIIDLVYSSTYGQYLDYNNILIDGEDAPETVREDYEFIWQGTTRYAFGDLNIHGASKTNFSLSHIGSGDIKVWVHGRGRTKPRWVAFVQTEIRGQGEESSTVTIQGSGTLFNFQYSAFARSFTYEARPSTLYAIDGASECAVFNTRPPSVDLKISGTAKQNFIPNWNGSGSVPFTGYAVERQTDHYATSGSLWSWAGGEEKRTYDYNALSSHVIFDYKDYGLVSGSVIDSWVIANHANETIQSLANDKIIDLVYTTGSGQYLDYQNILIDGQDAPETVTEDYEFIWQGITRYAFGDLVVHGASKTNFSLRHIGSGSLFTISKAKVMFPFPWTGHGTIFVSGESAPAVSYSETGSGSLFNIITGEEEITKDYVGSGGLFAMGGAAECVASIPPARTVDLKFTGTSRTRFTPNWNSFGTIPVTGILTEKYGPHYTGKGVLWNINSVDERRVYDYNGSSIDFFDRRNYGQVSTAVIDSWIIANHANVVIETIKDEVIGDLVYTAGAGQYLDYGHIELPQPISGLPGNLHQADITDDYQWIIAPDWDGTIYPFGGLSVSGDAHTPFTFGFSSVFDYESGRRADIQLDGVGIARLPPYWAGTGYIYVGVDDFAYCTFSLLHKGDGHIQTSGVGAESRIYAPYIGSGRLYGFDGAVESTLVASTASGHIVFSGAASIQSAIHYQGFGVISTLSGAAESIAFSPDEEQMLFSFEGRRLSEKVTVREISKGGVITLSGAGVETVAFVETFEGLVTLSGIATESIAPAFVGTGNISTLSGAAEAVTFNPEDLTTLFDIAGFGLQRVAYSPTADGSLSIFGTSGDPLLTYAESGSGTITTSGDGRISISLGVIGEGAIFSSGFGGEARTIKLPPMREAHILFSGTAVERVAFDPPEDGTHVLLTGAGSERYIPNWNGSGTLPVYGQGLESHTEVFTGNGNLFSHGLGGESITVKVPAIQADLYFVGTRISERRTYSEVGSGVLYNFSGASVTTTVSEVADGLFDIGGVGRISISLGVIGTGNISTFSGAAESITFNPEDKTTLFDIAGISTSRTTKSEVKRVEMRIGSTAEPVFFIPDYPGSGLISVSGDGGISVVRDLIGTGNISTLSGAAESFTYNPADITTLFDIAGIGTYRTAKSEVKRIEMQIGSTAEPVFFVPDYPGSGVIPVTGEGRISISLRVIGSGSISTLSGAAESFTVNPPDQTTLFEYKGTRISEKSTVREIGEGRLWEWGTAGANITFAPKGDGLFRIDGFIEERTTKHFHGEGVLWDFGNGDVSFTYAWAGSGLITVVGDAHASNTDVATGSGRISALSGGAEKTAFVPGTEVHTLSVTGEARVVITLSHVGSGSISTLSGAAESFTYNPADQTTLFDIAGRSVNRITKDYSVDAGLVTISGSAAESFVRASYPGTGDITTANEAEERTTVIEEGSGNISTFSGAAECVAFSPDEENMLFSYNGRGHVIRTRAYLGQIEVLVTGVAITNPPFGVHTGKGEIFVKGTSNIEFVFAAPSRTYGWIV